MTYNQWRDMIDGKLGEGSVDRENKKIYNKNADEEQYERYKKVLGEKAPKSFDDFKNVKYGEEYNSLKLQYADAKIQHRIKSGAISTKVLEGKQGKHILGHNNYIEGRSYINAKENIQELINKYAGNGTLLRDMSGKWTHKEIATADHVIGVAISDIDGSSIGTSTFTIHYSKKGVHIVPRRE